MDNKALPTGLTQTEGPSAEAGVASSAGLKKPTITVTTRSISATKAQKASDSGQDLRRPAKETRSPAAPRKAGEKVEPVQGLPPVAKAPAGATAIRSARKEKPGKEAGPPDDRLRSARSQVVGALAKAREEAAAASTKEPATPVLSPAPAAPVAPVAPAAPTVAAPIVTATPQRAPVVLERGAEERFPFLSEGRALETTVGEAILQVAATLGVPEEAIAMETLLVRRNLRSGQQLRHYGNLVVIGDVNAGAEVVATGDIIVVGALRGMAHAGAVGNQDAIVAAYYLHPTQLRIANYIGREPGRKDQGQTGPEIARVRNGQVVIEPYRVHAGRDL